jgi:peptidyl-prolyl cis-trans isomerase D
MGKLRQKVQKQLSALGKKGSRMLKWKRTTDLDAKSITKSWQSYTVLILAMGAMLFFGVCQPNDGGFMPPSGAAASVDGIKISSLDFRRLHSNMTNQYQQQFRDQFDPVAMGISQRVVDQLVDSTVLYAEANKNGIYASDEEIEKLIVEGEYFKGEKGTFDPELFKRYLKSQAHTEQTFTEEIRRNLVVNKFRSLLSSTYRPSEKFAEINYLIDESKVNVEYLRLDPNTIPVKIDQAEIDAFMKEGGEAKVKDYYEKNKSEFNQDKKVKARHILIAFKDARAAAGEAAKRTKDEAKALAQKVAAEAKAKSGEFAKLAEKYTDDPSGKSKGGDLGFFKQDQMVKEFSDVAFAMQPGSVSGVVESPFGFHIIKVETVQEAKSVPLEQAQKEIAEKLIARDRKPAILAEKVKALQAALKEGKGQDLMQELGVSWKETGDFNLGSRVIPGGLGSDKSVRQAIAGLKNPGDMTPEAVNVNGVQYILRLKSKTPADLTKLDEAKRKELVESAKFMESYPLFNTLTAQIRKKYENDGKIYKNPEFVQYDALLTRKTED